MSNLYKVLVIFILGITFSSLNPLWAQPLIEWQNTYGGNHHEQGNSIIQTFDGGFIIAGYTGSKDGDIIGLHDTTVRTVDGWIVRIDAKGKLLWQKVLGGTRNDKLNSIFQTKDSGFIVTGYTYSSDGDVHSNHGNSDVWLIKLSSLGDIQWEKTYGGDSIDIGYSVIQTKDGGFLFASNTLSSNGDITVYHPTHISSQVYYDAWIVKVDSIGNIIWQKTIGGNLDERAYSVIECLNGSYALCGHSASED